MKINKKGWSIQRELVFICIFLFCFILAGIGMRKLGLLDNRHNPLSPNFDTDAYYLSGADYSKMETRLIDASKEYVYDFYENILTSNTKIITVNKLLEEGYLKSFMSQGEVCSGYTEVRKIEGALLYSPYINCPHHISDGYSAGKDY